MHLWPAATRAAAAPSLDRRLRPERRVRHRRRLHQRGHRLVRRRPDPDRPGELRIHDFTLTAYDGEITGGGGVYRFRIRITKTNNGNVVFDNRNGQPTDMDTADPQAIAGGAIVIHKT